MNLSIKVSMVNCGSIRAIVDVTVNDLGMTIKNFKVIQNNGSAWVAPPSREYVAGGERRFQNLVQFKDADLKKRFSNRILEQYRFAVSSTKN